MNLPDRYRTADLVPASPGLALPGTVLAMPGDDRLDWRYLFTIFRRRLLMFALIVAIFFFVALNYTLFQPRSYQASANVVMNEQRGDLVPLADGTSPDAPLRSEQIETQLKVIQSQEIARKVVTQLQLEQDPELKARATGIDAMVTHLLGNLKAERLGTAYAMRISYTDADPKQAARIANGFAQAYATNASEAKRADNQRTLDLLRGRIDELRLQAQADFRAVQDFRVRNGLLSAQATQLSEQQASAFTQQLAAARAAAALDSGRVAASGGAASAATVNSQAIQSLKGQRAAISIRVAEMAGRYLDTHPDLVGARRELADIDAQIGAETSRVQRAITAGIATDANASASQAGAMQGGLSAARATLAANNRALVGLDDLSRKAQASQGLYESYLNRYKEVLAQVGTERPEARLLSAAQVPSSPVSPNIPLNLALGLLLGVLAGGAAAIATESAYSGLTTRDDVERRLGLRCLGGLPLLSSIGLGHLTPIEALVEAPGSAYSEAVRGLLTAIRQSGAKRHQVIAVTSALPGEGKSSFAGSLARAAANAGQSVILIDCDPVRRRQGELFGLERNRPGLREMLRDGTRLGDAMVKDAHSQAMILPITSPFGDGERLLERGNFHQMIAMLREHFSLIILDTAPILPIAEVRELVTLADDVVICVAWRKTPDSAVRSALQLLPVHAIDGIGVALTRIDMKKQARFGAGDPGFYYDRYKQYYVEAQPA